MDGEVREGLNSIDRFYEAFGDKLGLENPPTAKVIYQFPRQGKATLWVDLLSKEKVFKPWHYSSSLSVAPEDIVTIPESNTRSVIHFLPPEARKAHGGKDENRDFWIDDEDFRGKRVSIAKSNITAFTDLLNAIKNGELGETKYIIGVTNLVMANFARNLGFKRCWEEGYNPPDLTRPMIDENIPYKVGVSIAELVQMYDLENQTPTEESVLKVVRENKARTRGAVRKIA